MLRYVFSFLILTALVPGMAAPAVAQKPTCALMLSTFTDLASDSDFATQVTETYRRLIEEAGQDIIDFESWDKTSEPFDIPMRENSNALVLKNALTSLRQFTATFDAATRKKIESALKAEAQKLLVTRNTTESEHRVETERRSSLPPQIEKLKESAATRSTAFFIDATRDRLVTGSSFHELKIVGLTAPHDVKTVPRVFMEQPEWFGVDGDRLYWIEQMRGVTSLSLTDPEQLPLEVWGPMLGFIRVDLDPLNHRLAGLCWEQHLPATSSRRPEPGRSHRENASVLLKVLGTGKEFEFKLPDEFEHVDSSSWLAFVPGSNDVVVTIPGEGVFLVDPADAHARLMRLGTFVPRAGGTPKVPSKISPDGRFAVLFESGRTPEQVMIDTQNPQQAPHRSLQHPHFKGWQFESIAISADSALIAGITSGGEIALWDAQTGQMRTRSKINTGSTGTYSIGFLNDNRLLAVYVDGSIFKVNLSQIEVETPK